MMKISMNIAALLTDLSLTLVRFSPKHSITVAGLMLFRSLTAGAGMLLMIPLLHTIGIHALNASTDLLTGYVMHLFSWLPISLCLENLLLLFFLLMLGITLSQMLDEVVRNAWQERYIHHLRQSLYSALLGSRWEFFIKNKHSDLLHGVTAQLQAAWQCHFQWLQIVNQSILIMVYIALDFMVSWQMTLIACSFALLLMSVMRPLHRLTVSRGIGALKRNQVLFQAFYEQLSAFKMAKSSHQESILLDTVLKESLSMQKQSKQFTFLRAGSKGLFNIISVIAFIVLVYLALKQLRLPLNVFFILIVTFSRILPMISSIQQNYQQLLGQLPMLDHLKNLLTLCQMNQEITDIQSSIPFKKGIAFESVAFRYAPEKPWVFQALSFTLKKNTTTVIVGPSGAGKTTIADLIIGLLRPTSGHIKIDDTVLEERYFPAWRKKIAYVPQESFLFNTSIRDNLLMFCASPPSESVIWEALNSASASRFVQALPQGLDTIVGDRGSCLSGGERQRIALARAILMKPELLILDESTNALDDSTIDTIQQSLWCLHGKMTILIISHQWKMQAFSDAVIHLASVAQHQNVSMLT